MTQVFIPTPRPGVKKDGKAGGRENQTGVQGLKGMAEKVVDFHLRPFPEASPPPVAPFPPLVIKGLWAGILLGGVVGMIFGSLLYQNTLIIPRWEGLYSMGNFTFDVFWAGVGAALGLAVVGVSAIFITPGPPSK